MTRDDVRRWGLVLAIVGGVAWGLGVLVDPHDAWVAYLVALVSAMTIAVGALSLVLMAHLSDATWFVLLRRIAQAVAASVPILALLMIPAAFGLRALYPWLSPERLEPHVRELVLRKRAYLNLTFFIVRSVVYVAAWTAILVRLDRWSAQQDAGARPAPLIGFSAAAAIVLGFTLTFASFDWLMSLRPDWSSTVYGMRVYAGTAVAALGIIAVVMPWSGLPYRPPHAHALASLLLSFLIFWFYIAVSQLIVIWIGNTPAEITWYLARSHGPWLLIAALLLVGHFVVPFLLLLFKPIKQSPRAMGRVGLWLLLMHYVDVCWLAVPDAGISAWSAVWIYPAALVFVVSAAAIASAW